MGAEREELFDHVLAGCGLTLCYQTNIRTRIGANYQEMDGVSLPRSSLYENYLKWCGRIGYDAMTAASFGKLVKQRFPDLKTRRLGTRGQVGDGVTLDLIT